MINNFNKIKPLQDKINNLLLDIKDIKPSLYKEYSSIVNQSINNFIDLGIEYIEKNPQEFEIFLSKLNDIIKILTFIKTKENISENILKKLVKEVLQEKEDRCKRIADRRYDKPSAYKSGAIVRCRKGKIWKDLKEYEDLTTKNNYVDTDGYIDYEQLHDDLIKIKPYLKSQLPNYLEGKSLTDSQIDELIEQFTDNLADIWDSSWMTEADKLKLRGIWGKADIDTLSDRFIEFIEGLSDSWDEHPLNEDESLHKWFKRQGPKGKEGGWVDCNAPDGKGGYKACGRKEGEKRSKYPSCRPTPAKCKSPGKGKKWGKTK